MTIHAQVEVIEVTKEPLKEFKKGAYYTYAGLRKFEGTWVYQNNSEEFTIKIKNYKTYYEKIGIYMDNVSGNYCYKVNEELIDCDMDREDFSIAMGTQLSRDTPNKMTFYFRDVKKNKRRGQGTLEWLGDNRIRWRIGNGEVFIINGKVDGKNWDRTFSVPTNIIMTKVE